MDGGNPSDVEGFLDRSLKPRLHPWGALKSLGLEGGYRAPNSAYFFGGMDNLFLVSKMLQKPKHVRPRRSAAFDEIEADLDELEELLRKKPRRQATPAVGGGTLRPAPTASNGCIRPRPAAFARAIDAGLNPLVAAFQAGYRAPNRMTVWRLLRDPQVKAEIERLAAQRRSFLERGKHQ